MGRKRKQDNKHLPKGVYERVQSKRYYAKYWDTTKLVTVGTYNTPEEAEYMSLVLQNGHHWEGMETGPYFGFTYVITNKATGKRYVGKKQFFLWNGPVGGYKCSDQGSEWWDAKAWRDNDWVFYTGSQNDLNAEIANGNIWDFRYEVLEMCKTKLDLHVSELNHMLQWDVLEATDEQGEYLWYNKNIASLEFRPPFRKEDVKDAMGVSEEAMRVYYLKPLMDREGKVIPYGVLQNPCKDVVSPETPGRFSDVR